MFEVNKHKPIFKDFHKIVDNRFVLFNDGDNDIMFTGTNKYSNRLLCCIMFEDDDEGFLRYIHTLVSEKQYSDFINRNISFKEILDSNETVFLVDLDYSMNELDHNLIYIKEIPQKFIPLKNSFCPKFIFDKSFSYSVSLLGGLADLHRAEAQELSDVSTHFSDFLKSSTEFLNDLNVEKGIYIEALKAGSFEINYKIELKETEQTDLIGKSTQNVNDFLSNYFKYFFNSLPKEDRDVFNKEIVESKEFKILEKQLESIYEENFVLPPAGVEQKLIDLIQYSAKQIENIEYNKSFKEIKFQENTTYGSPIPYGVIDEEFIPTIKNKMFNLDPPKIETFIQKDEFPKEYAFRVYKFSSESGKGSAYFMDEKGNTSKIIIHAKGLEDYKHTKFTKSMDEGRPYNFEGIGEYENGLLKKVTSDLGT